MSWVTAEKVTQQVLWLVLFAVLAPILGPEPYGEFSIVMVFVGFCELVLGEGLMEALMTVDELSAPVTATAATVAIVSGLVVTALLVGAAPLIGLLFQNPTLTALVWTLAPLPTLALLSAMPMAILRRSLQYKRLAIRSIAGLLIGGLCGIALALAGFGAWALALQVLAQRAAEMVIAWSSVPHRFRFGWVRTHFLELRPVAVNVFGAQVATFATAQLPRLLLGCILGARELGLFVLGGRLCDIVVNTMIVPRLFVGRNELRSLELGSLEFRGTFVRMQRDVALLTFPVIVGAATLLPDFFGVWLDQRWQPGIVAAQLILLSALPMVFSYSMDIALLAAKRSRVFRKMATIQASTVLPTVLVAAPFGLNAVCLALAIRPWLLIPLLMVLVRRHCRLSPSDVLAQPLRFLVGAAIMAAIISLPVLRLEWSSREGHLLSMVALGILLYGAYAYWFCRDQLTAVLSRLLAQRT